MKTSYLIAFKIQMFERKERKLFIKNCLKFVEDSILKNVKCIMYEIKETKLFVGAVWNLLKFWKMFPSLKLTHFNEHEKNYNF